MNRIYKVVFSHKLQVFQVVSELARGHARSETPAFLKKGNVSGRIHSCMAALAVCSLLSGYTVWADSTVSGGSNITVTSDATASDGHTDYQISLNDTVLLGQEGEGVSLNGLQGTGTFGGITA